MSETLQEKATELLWRLEKEVAREGLDTATVGGITKAGTALEALLKVAAAASSRGSGSSLDAELRRLKLQRGAGSYARVLRDIGRAGASDRLSQAIIADLSSGKNSRISRVIELRNQISHAQPMPQSFKEAMRSLADWLRPLLVVQVKRR